VKYEPRQHQAIADRWLRENDHTALLLDMGLGKTVITLTVLLDYLKDSFRLRKVLVIAPKKVAEDTWTREQKKWDHLTSLRIIPVLGTEKKRREALATPGDVYIINRENVLWLVSNYGKKWPFDGLVIDELSSFKSSGAKRWRALKKVAPRCTVVWGLTGTPMGTGYMDLYAEMFLIDGGEHLGKTLTSYRERFFAPGAHKGHIVYEWRLKRGAKERIDGILKQFCLSMQSKDWLDMPARVDVPHYVHMTVAERKVYDTFEKEKLLPLAKGLITEDVENADSAVVAPTAAALTSKLLQMANGAVYDDGGEVLHIHDQKLDALEEIIEAAGDEPVLVYYNYKHDLDRIKARFPQAETLDTADDIRAWNDGETPLLLCHPASVAYGLNMQEGGHIIVWFGPTWSLELYQQANARLLRQGQTDTVFIHHILTADTYDDKVMGVLDQRDAEQSSFLAALTKYWREKDT
jgi:SNF2 family DNA or RNA helicase